MHAAPQVRISVGQQGVANSDVRQRVEVLASEEAKGAWLAAALPALIDEGDVIVFAAQKAKVPPVPQRPLLRAPGTTLCAHYLMGQGLVGGRE